METIWKRIPGYGLYECSNMGEIKTFNWKGCGRTAIMKPAKDGSGYLRTMLKRDDGVIHTVKVHRIICLTFHGVAPFENAEVNHKDRDKANNKASNLEWLTRKQNQEHCKETGNTGMFEHGNQPHNTRLTKENVLEIRRLYIPHVCGRKQLAEKFGVSPATIKDIILGKSWSHIQ